MPTLINQLSSRTQSWLENYGFQKDSSVDSSLTIHFTGDTPWRDFHIQDSDTLNCTPLGLSLMMAEREILDELIHVNVDIHKSAVWKYSALFVASEKGNIYGIRQLVARGASVNQINEPLTEEELAEIRRHPENRSESVERIIDATSMTPIFACSMRGNVEVCKVLIEYGADVNILTRHLNRTLIHYALMHEGQADLFVLLYNSGINKDIRENSFNYTHLQMSLQLPLTVGPWYNRCDCKKAEIIFSMADELELSIINDDINQVRTLVNNGCPVNQINADQQSSLHLATLKNNPEIISILLYAGADITMLNAQDLSPLDIALLMQKEGEDTQKAINLYMNLIQLDINRLIRMVIKKFPMMIYLNSNNLYDILSFFGLPQYFSAIPTLCPANKIQEVSSSAESYIEKAVEKTLTSQYFLSLAKSVSLEQRRKETLDTGNASFKTSNCP